VASTSPEFGLSTPDGSSFECKLDLGAYAACTSPKQYAGPLSHGSHTFTVRAKDAAGNIDGSPATRMWSIDSVAPDAVITEGPTAGTTHDSTTAEFKFASGESGTFECKLDSGTYSACTSPKSYTGLAPGEHNFAVRATDAVGNVDPFPATRMWMVNFPAPETTLGAGGPTGTVTTTSAEFSFSSNDPDAVFYCRLDGGNGELCTSPKTYTGLAAGYPHTFEVSAWSNAANRGDETPASRSWTIAQGSTGGGAKDDAYTLAEDSGATMLPVLTNDTPDAGAPQIDAASDPYQGGTRTIVQGSPDQISYTPRAEYCGSDSILYVINDGSSATAQITITCVDDAPAAVNDTVMVPQDSGPVPVNVLANDADPDGGAKEVASKTDGSHGVVGTMGGAGLTYQPLAGYCGPDSFGYALNGGSNATVSVMVVCGNRAPAPAINPKPATPGTTGGADRAAPQTRITKGPSGRVKTARKRARVKFAFGSNEAGSTFRCKIDKGRFKDCSSPKAYRLKPGKHKFAVIATDRAGNVDLTPAVRKLKVVRIPG
jgi:hypothetical protein